MTCPRKSRIFCRKICNTFSVLSIFKYNPGKTNNKFVKLHLNNFYPVISYRRDQKESDEFELYTVWSLVMVRSQLPAQVIKNVVFVISIFLYTSIGKWILSEIFMLAVAKIYR